MRLKLVRSVGKIDGLQVFGCDVVDAETGKRIDGIRSVRIEEDMGGRQVTITLAEFDEEILTPQQTRARYQREPRAE